ncbi:MAG: 50S ribosomal protein L15 [Nitrospirota bacterium]|nr:50S ribosomal protein L15 [Nitrospirota bacterium]
MKLDELRPPKGAKKKKKRVGCGVGSGHGKTSCKGHKGQKARSGGGKQPGFEGGQMPLARRLPKRGFNNKIFSVRYAEVNLRDIARLTDVTEINPEVLVEKGLVKKLYSGIKILGHGEITGKLNIQAHKFTAGALKKIEAAGGKAEVIN